jgi:hypothetical protein
MQKLELVGLSPLCLIWEHLNLVSPVAQSKESIE